MNSKLLDMVSKAITLRSEAAPVRANIVDILAALHHSDLIEISRGDLLSGDRRLVIAKQLGLSLPVVTGSLSKLITLDLVEYASTHVACKDYYVANGYSKREVTAILQDGYSDEAIYFVLHNFVERWGYNRSSYPLIGLGIEDDNVNKLCKGYLVSIGLAFETRIDLLDYSFKNAWPDWQKLWDYY